MIVDRLKLIQRLDEVFLAPGRIEEFAAAFLGVRDAARHGTLHRRGTNVRGQTIDGWPDLFALTEDAGLDVVSVTRGANASAVMRHLRDDAARVTTSEPGTIVGFTFFAWGPTPEGQALQSAARELISHGLPADRVTFIFQQELTQTLLRDPRYQRLLIDELDLRPHTFPFDDSHSADLFSDERTLFRPSRAEFESGVVHRPEAYEAVRERLLADGLCVVLGRGAAGKTVLGAHIALSPDWSRFFYLDLAHDERGQAVSQALEVMSQVGQPAVLFIVDNAHLAPRAALLLHDHWVGHGNGSSLLVLARVTSAPDDRITGRPLARLSNDALVLEAGMKDLAGIAQRLLLRGGRTESVPEQTLRQWEKTFAGDLIAFSLAFQGRIEADSRTTDGPRWTLEYQDAVDYVYRRYIADAPDRERESLFRVAALARYEMQTPSRALPSSRDLSHTVRHGLVLESRDEAYGERRLQLIHAGLGSLIAQAAGLHHDDLDALAVDTARTSLPTAIALARRAEGRTASEIGSVLRSEWNSAEMLTPLIEGARLRVSAVVMNSLVDQGVCSRAVLADALASRAGDLAAASRRDPRGVHHLLSLLGRERGSAAFADVLTAPDFDLGMLVIEAAVEGEWATLASLVAANDVRARTARPPAGGNASLARLGRETERLLRTERGQDALSRGTHRVWLGDLSYLLDALRDRPRTRSRVLAALGRPEGIAGLREMLAHRGVGAAAPLFRRLTEFDPGLVEQIFSGLDDEAVAELGRGLCSGRVDDLATVVGVVERAAPAHSSALNHWLSSAEGRAALRRCILGTSMDGIATVLDGTTPLPAVVDAALTELRSEDGISALARIAGRSQIMELLKLVDVWPWGKRVVAKIDSDTWHRQVLARHPESPGVITHTARALSQLGRLDLLVPLATAVVDRATGRQWRTAYLGPVATVLRYAEVRSAEDKLRFMDRTLDDTWVADQYTRAGPGALAGPLFGVWVGQPVAVIDRLADPSLADRVARELSRVDDEPENVGLIAQVYGSAALFIEVPAWTFPPDALSSAIDGVRPPTPGGITMYELQLLMGMLASADLPTLCAVRPDWVAAILANYRSYPLTGRSLLLKPWVIDWLSTPDATAPADRRVALRAMGRSPAPGSPSPP